MVARNPSSNGLGKRCTAAAGVAALVASLASPWVMSQGATGSGAGGGGGAAGSAGTGVAAGSRTGPATGTPGANDARLSAPTGAASAATATGASPAAAQGTPPPGSNTLPPLNANGVPPMNATGVNGVNSTNGAMANPMPLPNTLPARDTSAAQAFSMLDRSQLGYVTRADTDRLSGFMGFDNADTNRDGQLSPAEFATAWRFYSGQ